MSVSRYGCTSAQASPISTVTGPSASTMRIRHVAAREAARPFACSSGTSSALMGLPDYGQRPVVAMLGVEREEHHALPLTDAEASLAERHLLGTRSAPCVHKPL